MHNKLLDVRHNNQRVNFSTDVYTLVENSNVYTSGLLYGVFHLTFLTNIFVIAANDKLFILCVASRSEIKRFTLTNI